MSSHPLPCHPNRLFAHTLAPRSPSGHANIALPLRVTSHRHATTHPHLCRPTVPAHSPAPLVFSSFVPLYHYVRTHALPPHTHVLRPPLMTPPARLAARPTAPPTHDRRNYRLYRSVCPIPTYPHSCPLVIAHPCEYAMFTVPYRSAKAVPHSSYGPCPCYCLTGLVVTVSLWLPVRWR